MPWILVSYPPDFERLCRLYQDVAAGAGRKLGLGESVGAFRAVHFGRTQEEAVELERYLKEQPGDPNAEKIKKAIENLRRKG